MTAVRSALPWYIHPAEDPGAWQALAASTLRPSFVVVNVHDGPGRADDSWYPGALRSLRGVRLVGYVDVDYGRRPRADVLRDVCAWLDVHKVGGVMFDQLPSDAAGIARCSSYVSDARRAGAGFVVGNPGVEPQLGYLAMLDVTCVFEGSAAAYADFRPSAALARVPRARVWHLVHGCPPEDLEAVTARAARLGAGHAFVTDRTFPNPWAGFPASATPLVGAAGVVV
ncbi:MAG: putative signal peptide protein [Blastococcus sp.]|nr:putative signal peptide protein [Blastococcus sp.]